MDTFSFLKIFRQYDAALIKCFKKIEIDFARVALFIIYFWFGFLKIIDTSPAGPLVEGLFEKTLGFMSYDAFYASFAIFEMTIGVLFLIKGFERIAFFFLAIHLITTALPLFLMPDIAWQTWFMPTLEGQYIIKNILIIAAAIAIAAHLKPLKNSKSLATSR